MASEWARAFSQCARFDYVKLTFSDTHPIHRHNVDDTISKAMSFVYEKYQGRTVHLPKMTTLEPSQNKPNGKYIVELFGVAAECVHYLPFGWSQYLRYVHVKSFMSNLRDTGVLAIKDVYESEQGVRSFTPTYPGTRSRSPKGNKLPSLRSGSRKSGTHSIVYQRTGAPIGVEVRFRDEQVTDTTLSVFDLRENTNFSDLSGWGVLLFTFARKAAEFVERDFFSRNRGPEEFIVPRPYDECKVDCSPEEWAIELESLSDNTRDGAL